jgi:hypothetical protein
LRTHWELEREHVGNKGKKEKKSSSPLPTTQNVKGKEKKGTLSAC